MKPKTVICDIDGVIIKHFGNLSKQLCNTHVLNGVIDKLNEWDSLGYNIILITGRRESCRKATERQLLELGLFFDQLIMGVGGGDRVLINDRKPNSDRDTAHAINLERNKGLGDVDI